jgi:hypothetical protein
MSGKSQKVRLKAHLWSHLDGMASGMGKSPEVLLERAVTTLLNLHGYPVERAVAVAGTPSDPTPPGKPASLGQQVVLPRAKPALPLGGPNPTLATRVEGADHKMPVITGIVSGMQPTIQALPPTSNLRARPAPGLGDEDDDHPTQISVAHVGPREPSEELAAQPQDSGPLPEPVAAGEFVTSSRVKQVVETQFPESEAPDDEPPFVSDVIAVPPELYAPDSGARSVATVVPVSEEPRDPVSELTRGLESELTEAPSSELTHGLESGLTEAPSSELTHGLESGLTEAPSSELTHGLESEPEHAPPSEVTHGLESGLSEAPVSEVTHGLDSSLSDAPVSEVTHGFESGPVEAPISELTPTADAPSPARETDTQAMSPADVPWHAEPEPEPAPPPRVAALPPPMEEPGPPVAAFEEPAPAAPVPPPDADPARLAAAARIRAIAAELEQWVLPREDRAFNLDLPPDAAPAKSGHG